jgi:hypothetical protein
MTRESQPQGLIINIRDKIKNVNGYLPNFCNLDKDFSMFSFLMNLPF